MTLQGTVWFWTRIHLTNAFTLWERNASRNPLALLLWPFHKVKLQHVVMLISAVMPQNFGTASLRIWEKLEVLILKREPKTSFYVCAFILKPQTQSCDIEGDRIAQISLTCLSNQFKPLNKEVFFCFSCSYDKCWTFYKSSQYLDWITFWFYLAIIFATTFLLNSSFWLPARTALNRFVFSGYRKWNVTIHIICFFYGRTPLR